MQHTNDQIRGLPAEILLLIDRDPTLRGSWQSFEAFARHCPGHDADTVRRTLRFLGAARLLAGYTEREDSFRCTDLTIFAYSRLHGIDHEVLRSTGKGDLFSTLLCAIVAGFLLVQMFF
ncbi:MAG: hypothetical protein IJC43_00215 [Clostridia bacterium]|nr:hypothetical protein [Clostridia bacterium]